jgi:ABC-type uncharacterized transport system auxiliary subunit
MTGSPLDGSAGVALKDRTLFVDTIRVTDKLVRRDVLIQKNNTEYEYYHEAKWVARLPELVAEKLEVEFSRHNRSALQSEGKPVINVHGLLLAFEQVDSADDSPPYAHIKLQAQFRQEGASRHEWDLERTYEFNAQVDATSPLPKLVADTLSKGLEVIAQQMAEDAMTIELTGNQR